MSACISQGCPEKQNNMIYICKYLNMCLYMCVYIYIYYKELAHAIIEAKSQDLQLTSWRPRRADGIVPAQD